jgi:nitrogen regulatory protein P-II 2
MRAAYQHKIEGAMKYIIAIIQPGKLDAVHEALGVLGISGMTVSEVKGYGRQKGKSEIYRGAEYVVNFIPKVKIEVAVEKKAADDVVTAIKTAAGTGKIGDGKVFVLSLEDAMRIRTAETGADAL